MNANIGEGHDNNAISIPLRDIECYHDCNSHKRQTYAAKSLATNLPVSTIWYREHGRRSADELAQERQYLKPQEEKALTAFVLQSARSGYYLPVRSLRSLAAAIAARRDGRSKPPSKNWPQHFYKRNPQIVPRILKAIDDKRDKGTIYEKVEYWFNIIGPLLRRHDILPENVYNMDETGVLLSYLTSMKVLTAKDDRSKHRSAPLKREMVTAIECISADGRFLDPLIIWPAASHRTAWTSVETPGWQYAHSPNGYTDKAISLHWIKYVFEPQTSCIARGRPRVLINDGFGAHEVLEILEFCHDHNIILCRLPSHTSHKTQPCDVGVFGPVKAAYRNEVERTYRGGSGVVDKRHFALLYKRARERAMTKRNITSAWSRAGLFPFNPSKVLHELSPPAEVLRTPEQSHRDKPAMTMTLQTPVTADNFDSLFKHYSDTSLACPMERQRSLDKLSSGVQRIYARNALLESQNLNLKQQNNEKRTRETAGNRVSGQARIMSYEDILEAQRKRDEKIAPRKIDDIVTGASTAKRRRVQKDPRVAQEEHELAEAEREIYEQGLQECCSVFRVR